MLSTESVNPAERFAFWREVICQVYVRLDAEPVGAEAFSGSIDVGSYGEVQISSVSAGGQIVQRALDDNRDDCLVSLQQSGIGRVSQAGRTAVLQPGDFALYDAARPYELAFDGPFSQIVVQFPRSYLIDRHIDIEWASARRNQGSEGIASVAVNYLRTLRQNDACLEHVHKPSVGDHAVDLIGMVLATSAAGRPTADTARSFTRQRVLDFVAANADNSRLSVGWTADELGVSTRYLQKLFAGDECGLSDRIRQSRLAKARSALIDPLRAGQTITRIASDCGYSDAAHFSRAFKTAYGETPRDHRRKANLDEI